MVGVDIVLISRISGIKSRFGDKFLEKIATKNEKKFIKNDINLAGIFAAKEAASKALGVGICEICEFKDIEILKDQKNKPVIKFSGEINKIFKIKNADVSISHDGGFAIAVVVIETF